MSSAVVRKFVYFPLLLAAAAAGIWAVLSTDDRSVRIGLVCFALVLLVIGQIGRSWLSNLFKSRAWIGQGRFAEARDAAQLFLKQLDTQPWRRHGIWACWGVYSISPRAMAENNLGAAFLELGALDQSEAALRRAVAADPTYAIPHFNLALLAKASGNEIAVEEHLAEAVRCGYSGGRLDAALTALGDGYSRFVGRTT